MFFALFFNSLAALSEISNAFAYRPISMKQKGYSFYHPSVEALQNILSDLPIKIVTAICFSFILYFLAGLKRTAGQFFFFLLFLIMCILCLTAFFQMIASLTKVPSTANTIGGVAVSILAIYTGYMIATPDMHPWFRWLNYINPLAYGFESILANEFHGREMPCNLLVPSGPGYQNVSINNQVCAFAGSVPGQIMVSGDNYLANALIINGLMHGETLVLLLDSGFCFWLSVVWLPSICIQLKVAVMFCYSNEAICQI